MTRKLSDLELLILGLKNSSGEVIEGRTKLQKMVFLLEKMHGISFSYHFTPYFYGPYSSDLQTDVDYLVSLGLVTETRELTMSGIRYTYRLTEGGSKLASTLASKHGRNVKFTKTVNELSKYPTDFLIVAAKTLASTTS
jgi:uncharacterized protein YwgA